MANERIQKKRFSDVRRQAGEILSKNGNRLLLIEALMISLLFVALYLAMAYTMSAVMSVVAEDSVWAFLAICVYCAAWFLVMRLSVMPMFLGLIRLVARMCAGDTPVLADLFYYFSTAARYRQARVLTQRTAWLVSLMAFSIFLTTALWSTVTVDVTDYYLLVAFSVLYVLAIIAEVAVFLFLLLVRYPVLYWGVRCEGVPPAEAKRVIRTNCKRGLRRGLRFAFGFLPQIVLGILTIGVLLIADIVPRMLVAYCMDCDCEQKSSFC